MKPDPQTGLPYLVDDLNMRLNNSLVKYNGQPAYVVGIDGRTLSLYLTRTRDNVLAHLPDNKLDIRPVPLGYVNLLSHCVYVSRRPERRYKQGLNTNNIRVRGKAMRMDIPDLLQSVSLAKSIGNDYPSFANALKAVKGNPTSRAWSRRWALKDDDHIGSICVCHRGNTVGTIIKGKPHLFDKFIYLQEELEASL